MDPYWAVRRTYARDEKTPKLDNFKLTCDTRGMFPEN